MYCISISYKTAGVDVRRRLAFGADVQARVINEILGGAAAQCVVLCTCNRTEVYFDGDSEAAKKVEDILSAQAGFHGGGLARFVMRYVGDGALCHLFRTAAGLDSMVVGEDEILRQLKEAYSLARECGAVGGDFNIIFQAAFACAKKIKTETALSNTSVSVATLAANEAARLPLERVNVLLIGSTGKTGLTVLKNLASHKNVSVTAAVRNHGGGFELVKTAENVRTADYSERYKFIDSADCVISATSSPHYTVTAGELRENIVTDKPRLLIDLAVPPDIDEAATEINGVRLIGIDYFERLAEENNALKSDSAQTASAMIDAQLDELKKELCFREFLPCLDGVKRGVNGAAFEELIYRMKSQLDCKSFGAVLDVLKTFERGDV